MIKSCFSLYNESYIGEFKEFKVFVGGSIDTSFAKEEMTWNFVEAGIKECSKERDFTLTGQLRKTPKIGPMGMNRGSIVREYEQPMIIYTKFRDMIVKKQKYQFVVHWAKKEVAVLLWEDKKYAS